MTTPIEKDHELLIRIDERLLMLNEKLSNIEKTMSLHQSMSNENKKRLDKIENLLYGTNSIDGIYKKVEKHDKLLTKAMAYFTLIVIVVEFLFKLYFHGGI